MPEPGPLLVFVDARNVLRSRWPNLGEQELVDLCSRWAEAGDRVAGVVFDGSAPGGLVGEREVGEHCIVVGAGEESADEYLERAAGEARSHGRAYWLVTSDRALREVAGRGAERTIGGGTFLRDLAPPA